MPKISVPKKFTFQGVGRDRHLKKTSKMYISDQMVISAVEPNKGKNGNEECQGQQCAGVLVACIMKYSGQGSLPCKNDTFCVKSKSVDSRRTPGRRKSECKGPRKEFAQSGYGPERPVPWMGKEEGS